MNKIFPNCLLFFFLFFIFSCAGDREKKDNSELYSKSQTRGAIIERTGVTMGGDDTAAGRKLQMEVAENKIASGGGLFGKIKVALLNVGIKLIGWFAWASSASALREIFSDPKSGIIINRILGFSLFCVAIWIVMPK